jgi:hypothetical protein
VWYMIKRILTLDNALNITSRISINDAAGSQAGCTIVRARAPVRPGQVADAHLKRHGPPSAAVVVAVTDGRLDFGTWEKIFYGEFDGRRRKRVLVKIIGE